MGLRRLKDGIGIARRLRAVLLASSAVGAVGHGVLPGAAIFTAVTLTGSIALAAGGQGGNPKGAGTPDGAGGTGFNGQDGQNSFPDGAFRGGGGGGAGGGNGGIGDFCCDNAAGGAGGTSLTKDGGNGTNDSFGGGGGGGGYNGNGPGAASITNSSPLAGGNGGRGGTSNFGSGGGGGAGGYGAVILGTGASSNTSSITGGTGGAGGGSSANFAGSGGDGGVGVWFNAAGATFTNSGTVTGGAGGVAGGGNGGANGLGGVGVSGADLTVIMNGGSISGGLGGDGVTQADAIAFTGGANTLTLNAGALTGNISIVSGGNIAFNESGNYTLSNTITGAGSISHTGTGTLTLSAANTFSDGTTISAGTIAVSHIDPNNLFDGFGSGAVTLDGGKLLTTVTGSLSSDLSFADNKTSILAAATGTTLTLGGSSTTGNTATNFTVGNNGVIQFGTSTDTGTIRFGASSQLPTINGLSSVVIAGGTLQDYQDSLWYLLANVSSVTVASGATLDYNDSNQQYLVNLNGAGDVKTGATGTSTLQVYSLAGSTNTFSGVISGSHPVSFLTPGGAATMILSGDNTYTGGTTICACMTLQLGNGGTTGSVVGNIINENTLIFNRSNTYTFNGVISNTGDVVQNGTGKTILTATSAYTGATTVNAGTLSVNGDITSSSGLTVNAGGTLGGDGFVPATVINAGGALAPGNSIGTLTVNGNLTFNAGSSYNIEVSPSAADRTNVIGTAALGGAVVNATYVPGSYVAKQYTILNATVARTGFFSALNNINMPAAISTALSYDANNVYLDLTLNFVIPGSGLNANQRNVGNALTNSFNTNGGIAGAFAALSADGLSQASGEPGASIPTAGFAAMNQFINAMMDGPGGNGGFGAPLGFAEENAYAPKPKLSRAQTEAYAAVTPRDRAAIPFTSRWNIWATGYGGNSTNNGDATTGSHSTSTRVYGTAVGADYRATPDTRFGFALGGAGTNFTVDNALGGGRADVFQAGAYARHTMGAAYIAAAVAYAWQDITTDRTVTVSGTDKLHAELQANALSARLESGWRYAMPAFAVTPYAGLQSTAFYLPSYAETATSGSNQFALSYGSKTVTATRSELGARFDKAMPLNDAVVTLRGRAAWAHDWNTDRSATATFQSLPGATFTVNGATPSTNAALISAGADLAWGNGWTVTATFDGEFSSTTRGYAGKGSLRYAW